MAIKGPVNVDAYNMIASLADNYLKNRDLQQQYREKEAQMTAQENLARGMQSQNPDYYGLAGDAMRMGRMAEALQLHRQAAAMGQGNGQGNFGVAPAGYPPMGQDGYPMPQGGYIPYAGGFFPVQPMPPGRFVYGNPPNARQR